MQQAGHASWPVRDWMSQNFLQLNSDKTEVLIIAPEHLRNQSPYPIY